MSNEKHIHNYQDVLNGEKLEFAFFSGLAIYKTFVSCADAKGRFNCYKISKMKDPKTGNLEFNVIEGAKRINPETFAHLDQAKGFVEKHAVSVIKSEMFKAA